MDEMVGKLSDQDEEVDVAGERDEGSVGQVSGGVVEMVGTPLMNWTIGGENQCPRPLYLSTRSKCVCVDES